MGTATKGTASRTESLLRPREIQVRIRSGQSPETVAAAAQTSVERVMVFATPVLAERAFVAEQAAKASVRRRGGDGPVGLLGDAVAGTLDSVGTDPESVEWDAWRREDGRWTVVAQYADPGDGAATQRAEFTYDAIGRYVLAEDDAARWLVGERRSAQPSGDASPQAPDRTGGRETGEAAGEAADDVSVQLVLGDDALRVVTGRPLTTVAELATVTDLAEEPTADLTEVARSARAAAVVPDPVTVVAPEPTLQPQPELPSQPAPQPATSVSARQAGRQQGLAAAEESSGGDGLFEDAGLRTSPRLAAERRQAAASARSRSRRAMPSWDDIMLGSAPRSD